MTDSNNFYRWEKMGLFITDRCNLVCKMCPIIIADPKALNRKTLPREIAFQAADFAEKHHFQLIELAGGEATLIDYFWELLERMCNIGTEVRLATNALLLKEDHIRTLASYPNLDVQVSIDGLQEIHDKIRGAKRAFSRSAANLERLAEAGCKRLSINTVVQRHNFKEMLEIYEHFKHIPYLYHAFSVVEEDVALNEDCIPPEDCDEAISIFRELMHRAKAEDNDVILTDDLIEMFKYRIKYPHYMMHPGAGCTVVQKSVVIFPDGSVIPCMHKQWLDPSVRRSLHEQTLEEIVYSPEYLGEVGAAIAPEGCIGCSTMCYNWDEDFREKVMHPTGKYKLRRTLFQSKEYLRENHPVVFGAAKKVRSALRV